MANSNGFLDGALKVLREVAERALDRDTREQRRSSSTSRQSTHAGLYPGDYVERPTIVYQPRHDAEADPGEIVWTWVPYEEDHSKGKDRPVLLIGHDGPWLLGLQVTSQDHDRDAAQEARAGRYWVDIGAGAWDSTGRPSWVNIDRVFRVHAAGMRRETAGLPAKAYATVEARLRQRYGWR